MKCSNVLFVTGTGRCGSSVFFEILSGHEGIMWLASSMNRKYSTAVNRRGVVLRGLAGDGLPGRAVGSRFRPSEAYGFWNRHFRGFAATARDLEEHDVMEVQRKSLPDAFGEMVTSRRAVMAAKITGWPRIGFLKEIFPEARFLHIVRDGRAVVNSMLNVEFWQGWRGPWNWRMGLLKPEDEKVWIENGRSYAILAALQWNMLMDRMRVWKQRYPGHIMDIRYEDMCARPVQTFKKALEFGGVKWSRRFEGRLKSYRLKNTNDKWKENLRGQEEVLAKVMSRGLREYGYM